MSDARTDPPNDAHALLRRLGARRTHATMSQSVATQLEELILRGELHDGQRLPTEPELGEALGVSRSVLRDAIRMLIARGLLDVRQGQGTLVSAPSSETYGDAMVAMLMRSSVTIGEVMAARAALETQLAPLAARNGESADWARMEHHLERFADAVDHGHWPEAHAEHLRFHLGLFSALHLPVLNTLLAPIEQCILLTSFPPQPDPALWEVDNHPPILDALRAGDGEAAQRAVRRHFSDMDTEDYAELRATPFQSGAQLEAYRLVRDQDAES
jgi:GntR family transcriptional repressor for pyruvate dehydrogenase complex